MAKIVMGQRQISQETVGWLLRERDCKQGHDFEKFCAEVLKVRLARNGKPSRVYDLTGTDLDEWRGVDACVDDVRVDWTLRGDNKSFTEWVAALPVVKDCMQCATLHVGIRTGNESQDFRPVMVFWIEYSKDIIKYRQLKAVLVDLLPRLFCEAYREFRRALR